MTNCTSCSQPLPAGTRSDAKFCSTACRMRSHRRNRRTETAPARSLADVLADMIHPGLATVRHRSSLRKLFEMEYTADQARRIFEVVLNEFADNDTGTPEEREIIARATVDDNDDIGAPLGISFNHLHVPAIAIAVIDAVRSNDPVGRAAMFAGIDLRDMFYECGGPRRLEILNALLTFNLSRKRKSALKADVARIGANPDGQFSEKVSQLVVTLRNVGPLKPLLLAALVA